MKCPHCLKEIHAEAKWQDVGQDAEGQWFIERYLCPNPKCNRLILYLVLGEPERTYVGNVFGFTNIERHILIRPKGTNRPPVPPECPPVLAQDYIEACLVLPDSPKASAALSRRCLQHLLREVAKVKPGNLADEIQQLIDSGTLPSHLVEVVDTVRNIGNFAAHPLKSQKSGEILPVEPAEAEWNLDVLEALFDFYFVQPAITARKKAALDQKLRESGQKPTK